MLTSQNHPLAIVPRGTLNLMEHYLPYLKICSEARQP